MNGNFTERFYRPQVSGSDADTWRWKIWSTYSKLRVAIYFLMKHSYGKESSKTSSPKAWMPLMTLEKSRPKKRCHLVALRIGKAINVALLIALYALINWNTQKINDDRMFFCYVFKDRALNFRINYNFFPFLSLYLQFVILKFLALLHHRFAYKYYGRKLN